MAAIAITYVGGGSTRAVGTMASFMEQGANFDGSVVTLFDVDGSRLPLVRRLAQRMADGRGLDIRIECTTDRRAALDGADAVLSSFRPGGFEARVLDERIPLEHGVIGQETQGPGGFFMALRAITAMREILDDMVEVCPGARLFNYTNPINIVGQAVSDHSEVETVSLCEGPIVFPQLIVESVGLDPELVEALSVGLNHGSWSVEHRYDGRPLIPALQEAWDEHHDGDRLGGQRRRLISLAIAMGSLPSGYFQYYFFEQEILAELGRRPTTRSQDILAHVDDYWSHYEEQAESDDPTLDPARSRGGIHELELAIDCMDAVFNDRDEVMPVNVANRGSIPGFPDGLVVETIGRCDASGVRPLPVPPLPSHLRGLVEALAWYQQATADAAWSGTHVDGVRALASHPLVRSLETAESLYRAMAHAHRDHLPDRLVPA